eukprot:scaffold175327_cov20-Cyclotella_meneghiniana.AAC.1
MPGHAKLLGIIAGSCQVSCQERRVTGIKCQVMPSVRELAGIPSTSDLILNALTSICGEIRPTLRNYSD